MSVSDPLLKRLKGCVLELRAHKGLVYDSQPALTQLCQVIEDIFNKGLRKNRRWFGKENYWYWIGSLPSIAEKSGQRINPLFGMAIKEVNECKKLESPHSRGRLFIRYALARKIVTVPVEKLRKSKRLTAMWYEPYSSILGCEILAEILMSLLFEVTEVNFHLNLKNASFLDDTWDMPVWKEYEFVPCQDLGIFYQSVDGRPIIVDISPDSVVDEHGKIVIGDILDELNGDSVRGAKTSKLQAMFRKNSGWPIRIGIIKRYKSDGQQYAPIQKLLQQTNIPQESMTPVPVSPEADRRPPHALLPEEIEEEQPVHGPDQSARYEVFHVGNIRLGGNGCMERINDAIMTALCEPTQNREFVTIEMGETNVIVTKETEDNSQVIIQHAYPEISACGRRTDFLLHLAFIAGETTCSLAKEFMCYIFEAKSQQEAKTILCTIAQGFERTHWYV